MSAIDELKKGAEPEANVKKVSINDLNKNKNKKREPITLKQAVEEMSTVDDTNDINKVDSPDTYVESLLSTENADSDFMKHVTEKTAEMNEWMNEQEEKKALEEEEHDIVDDEDDDYEDRGGIVIDATGGASSSPEEDEDLSNPKMMEADTSNSDLISLNIDGSSSVDDEDEIIDATEGSNPADEESESVEETVPEEEAKEEEKPAEEPKKEEKKKKEQFTASEIDIEVSQDNSVKETKDDSDDEEDDSVSKVDDEDDDTDETMERLKKITTERLKPASLNLNLSSFTIVKKPKVNASKVYDAYKSKISKWVLFNQKTIVLMREFSGSELEMLMEYYGESRRSADAMRRMFNMIYDHIASAKPANFETWLKITPYSDLDNYFFAIYIASFNGANYIPIDCSNKECNKSYITDNISIMDSMVKFDTKEKKAEFARIYQSEVPPTSKGIYTSEIVPLSYKVAIGFKEPTLWDRIEIDSIDSRTQTEFSSILGLIPYIDAIYEIDTETQQLIPIGYKEFPENKARTTRSKIKKYNAIFNSLTIDEFTPVKAYVSALLDKTNRGIDYVIPETTCPECGHVNEEVPIGQNQVADMVFTRCQLGALVNTSIK